MTFAENVGAGRRILLDSAVDPDKGKNGVDKYDIVEGNELGRFRLVTQGGGGGGGGGGGSSSASASSGSSTPQILFLETTTRLDREERDSYRLKIACADGGNPRRVGYLVLYVSVLDDNDNSPKFTQKVSLLLLKRYSASFFFFEKVVFKFENKRDQIITS